MPRIFISYSRDDVDWAKKLNQQLQKREYDTFFDDQSLRVGDNWEKQVLDSLRGSDHFVVLWSAKARDSDWVQRERATFDTLRYDREKPVSGRRLIHVLLDKTAFAYSSDQGVTEFRQAEVYAAGATTVSDSLWEQVVDRIVDSLNENSIPVKRALVTMTKPYVTREGLDPKEFYKCVDFDYAPPEGRTLNDLLTEMNISRAQLAAYYGEKREDWIPFGGGHCIREVLDQVRRQLNGMTGAVPIRWEPVEDDLMSGEKGRVESAATMLGVGLALVVIDPVALYSRWVLDLLQQRLTKCLENRHAVLVVLPLFSPPPQPRAHADMVRQVFLRLVEQFYEELPSIDHAQCSILAANDADIRRLVRASLGRVFSGSRQGASNVFLGMRGS